LTNPTKKEPIDLESMLKMVKKLSNEVVDIKNNFSEGTFDERTFRPFHRRTNIPKKIYRSFQFKHKSRGIGDGQLFTFHQANHSKKTFG